MYKLKLDEKPASTNIYVDKTKFLEALTSYKELCDKMAPEVPRVPEFIGECIKLIAENLARRDNFSRYSWREDMVGDGIETCLKYVKSFDPYRGTSPFAYFSQVCWFSFITRIKTEKKQGKIKREIVRYTNFETFSTQDHDDNGEFNMQLNEFLSGLPDEEPEPEDKKKAVKVVSPLEDFLE